MNKVQRLICFIERNYLEMSEYFDYKYTIGPHYFEYIAANNQGLKISSEFIEPLKIRIENMYLKAGVENE